jgi:hypothetical protein
VSRGLGPYSGTSRKCWPRRSTTAAPLASTTCGNGSSPALSGGREDALRPARERSLRRAIKGLVDRGEILPAAMAGPGDPRRYTTVECFARATGETVKDTAHAKAIVAEMSDALSKMSKLGASK